MGIDIWYYFQDPHSQYISSGYVELTKYYLKFYLSTDSTMKPEYLLTSFSKVEEIIQKEVSITCKHDRSTLRLRFETTTTRDKFIQELRQKKEECERRELELRDELITEDRVS